MKKTITSRSPQIQRILKNRFGFDSLREGQREVIDSVLSGHPTLAIMPTGAGKSLCFQLPALFLKGTTLVVSPLIALMKDQKEKLDQLDIEAVELSSTLSGSEQNENVEMAKAGQMEFLYVTPEKLSSADFLESMKDVTIDLLVIDEAHCLSQWGHDFRPAYLYIVEAWRRLGEPQILALTATATQEVVQDIQAQLRLPQMKVISSGVFRKNIFYEAELLEKESQKSEKVFELLKELSGSGIIYCASVKSAEQLYDQLNEQGYPVDIYHGRLTAKERTENRVRFMESSNRLMVATNAFGMGIDKPDIRFILHFQFPGSLEAYYQESGRAGRDGQPARCILLYLKQDKRTQSFFLAGKYPSFEQLILLYKKMESLQLQHGGFILEDLLMDLKIPQSKIKVLLAMLKSEGYVISLKKKMKLKKIEVPTSRLEQLFQNYQKKKEADAAKLKQMIIYSQTAMCRWKILLNYFEQDFESDFCDSCDNCRKNKTRGWAQNSTEQPQIVT